MGFSAALHLAVTIARTWQKNYWVGVLNRERASSLEFVTVLGDLFSELL